MRNIFAMVVVLSLVTLLGPYVPAVALGGCGLHHHWCGGGYSYGGCGYGGYDYGGCGYGGWANAGYLYGGGCGYSGTGYGYGWGGYGHGDWRFGIYGYGGNGYGGFGYPRYGYGGYGYGGCANCFSMVAPAPMSATVARSSVSPSLAAPTPAVASVEAEFENRIVAAAERVLRPSIAGPATTFVSRTDAAPTSRNTLDRNPALAEVLAGEARHLYWERNYQESLKMLEEAVRADEQSASAWYFIGLCHRALGNTTAAEASFAKGVAYYPTDSTGQRRMSQILERVQGSLRMQLENARLKLRRDLPTAPVVVTASR